HLVTLLHDLRSTPAGAREANPFQKVTPIRIVEGLPQMELGKPLPQQPAVPADQAKIAPDLRGALAEKEEAATPRRVEIILWTTPAPTDRMWQDTLRQAGPDLVIEGQLGPVVSVSVPISRVPTLAALPIVSVIRSPRPARAQIQPAADGKDTLGALG